MITLNEFVSRREKGLSIQFAAVVTAQDSFKSSTLVYLFKGDKDSYIKTAAVMKEFQTLTRLEFSWGKVKENQILAALLEGFFLRLQEREIKFVLTSSVVSFLNRRGWLVSILKGNTKYYGIGHDYVERREA